jgi:hypothetical protein
MTFVRLVRCGAGVPERVDPIEQDGGMRTQFIASITVLTLLGAACGGSDAADVTTPEITLLPTTTIAPPEPIESGPESTDVEPPESVEVTTAATAEPETDVSASSAPETTTAPSGPSTTVGEVDGRFSLTTSGLGATSFGADPDGTIAYVSSFLGQPTADTGWVDPFTIGPCGGTELRQVTWGNLQLEFGDASTVATERRHFYSYTYGQEGSSTAVPSGLATPENITVGSTVGALLAAYPGTLLLIADEFTPDSFVVNDDLRGRLSGLTDADVVELIVGGLPCEG